MTYYRIASHDRRTAKWIWKTTPLTSLQAVLQLLRSYSALPQESIRVFTAASKEDMNEMLKSENMSRASGSVTAAQFLWERKLQVSGQAQSALSYNATEPGVRQTTAVATGSPVSQHSPITGFPDPRDMSWLEKRRLEIESGPGGDHDIPYRFTLPISMPQLLAWTRLQTRLHGGEVQL
ncbi:MAG: hypothetical protein JOZ18_00065 [Chloroflexi bacterium]|nr:hypothetical protein [Chloroflexota bacterium]